MCACTARELPFSILARAFSSLLSYNHIHFYLFQFSFSLSGFLFSLLLFPIFKIPIEMCFSVHFRFFFFVQLIVIIKVFAADFFSFCEFHLKFICFQWVFRIFNIREALTVDLRETTARRIYRITRQKLIKCDARANPKSNIFIYILQFICIIAEFV